MAGTENQSVLEETLKPFYQRASEAEERLSRLEAALASKKDFGNEDHSELISVQSKLKDACAEVALAQEKNKKLTTENDKLRYHILHLIRAVRDADDKLEKKLDSEVTGDLKLDAEVTGDLKLDS